VGGWRRLHSEELHNLCTSSNTFKMIKSWTVRWVVYVAHMRDEKCIQNFGQKIKGRNHSEDLGIDGMIVLEWILGT